MFGELWRNWPNNHVPNRTQHVRIPMRDMQRGNPCNTPRVSPVCRSIHLPIPPIQETAMTNMTNMITRLATITLAVTFTAFTAAPLQAHTPEEQLGFARQLLADGDQAFALLEHKRFLHHHRNHKDAPAAAITTAKLYLGYLNDPARANQELTRTAAIHKNTAGGKQLLAFQQMLAANNDNVLDPKGKALNLYFAAEADEQGGKHNDALTKYNQLITQHRSSKLIDDALMRVGTIQLEKTNQTDKAGEAFLRVINDYPKSEHFPDANLMYVMTIEKQKGPTPEVTAAYQRIASRFPNTATGQRATARLKAIEKATVVYKREYNKNDVVNHAVRKTGYMRFRDQFDVHVELPSTASDKQIHATLEDALVKHIDKRTDKKHGIQVEAYFSYPLSKAGTLTWLPDQKGKFAVKKRDTEDKIKDTLLDLLKKRD